MDTFLEYLKAFAVGGVLCAIGQLLIDKTKLTPARILTAYVVAGVILAGILASIMSTAESQLLAAASSVSCTTALPVVGSGCTDSSSCTVTSC